MDAYERTPAQKNREFMSIRSLGDLTPTALLRKMRRLRPQSEHDSDLFRFGFLRVLPSDVSNILVVLEDEPLDGLPRKADRILEQWNDAPGSVAAISSDSTIPASVFTVGEVDAVRQLLRGRDSRGASSTPSTSSSICRNDAKWGSKAFNCRPGCLFSDIPLGKRSGNSNAGR